MNNLTITKEKVLEAAAKCSTAKETLKTLFPECFEEDKKVSLKNIIAESGEGYCINPALMDSETKKSFVYTSDDSTCFLLSKDFDWEIKKYIGRQLCLIPTKK